MVIFAIKVQILWFGLLGYGYAKVLCLISSHLNYAYLKVTIWYVYKLKFLSLSLNFEERFAFKLMGWPKKSDLNFISGFDHKILMISL